MDIKIIKEPVEHIVIDNFWSENECRLVVSELEKYEDRFFWGKMYDIHKGYVDDPVKKVKTIDMYGQLGDTNIISCLFSQTLWGNEMRKFYKSQHHTSIWSMMSYTNADYSIINSFGDGCYYDWHCDIGLVTTNLFVNPNHTFEGGDFILTNQVKTDNNPYKHLLNGEERKEIVYKFKAGRCILFPSLFLHKVTEVKTIDNQIKNTRISIQNRTYIHWEPKA